MLSFDRLRTPPGDGEVLIEPTASHWPRLVEENVRGRFENEGTLLLAGIPAEAVRFETRARLFGPDLVEPVIACGHQPEFAHPGVWAKHVVVHEVAGQWGLRGTDLVVDNDAPRSTALALPKVDPDGAVSRRLLPVLRGTTGAAYEGRPPLSPAAIDDLQQQVAATLAGVAGKEMGRPADTSPIVQYFRGLASVERPRDFVDQHLAARARIDRTLAADLDEVRVSQAFDGPFVADILLDLERFAHAYNASLAEYRREQQVRSPDRPLPDLKRTADRIEAPFWIYEPLQQRRRLWVGAHADAVEIYADDQRVGTLSRSELLRSAPAALASLTPWVIRPRALTLTLWARLLVSDLFVHGIGGAKYDRINDEIFRRYYRCEPPPYACVTATLRLPLPRFAASRAEFLETRRRVRDLQFNPQRYLRHAPAELLSRREQLIASSTELRARRGSSLERRGVFHELRQINAMLADCEPGLAQTLEGEAREFARRLESNAVAQSREFFYALQPRARLESLASRLREAARALPLQA